MGNCASTNYDPGASARSAAIDRQIEEDSKIFRKECKILLLGTLLSIQTLCGLRSEYGVGRSATPSSAEVTHSPLQPSPSLARRTATDAGQR